MGVGRDTLLLNGARGRVRGQLHDRYGGWVEVLAYMAGDFTETEWALRMGVPPEEISAICRALDVRCKPPVNTCWR